jgi:5-formyltetrahydrofolate cyclo-ligase
VNKVALRKQYLAERKKLSESQLMLFSQDICFHFANWLSKLTQHTTIQSVHCFLPIRKQKEINTYLIVEYLRQHHLGTSIILSKISPNSYDLKHLTWDESVKLVENHWGIPEPQTGELFSTDRIDLVLVPLLIFDQIGHRIGYGKGFYDRFLAECRPETIKIGLSLFPPVAVIDDINGWDVRLNYCITPEKVWEFT